MSANKTEKLNYPGYGISNLQKNPRRVRMEEFELGEATLKVLYTGNDNKDLNNTSIVLRGLYGNTSFRFMGDATSEVEKEILNSK